jgi:hypothetical protein
MANDHDEPEPDLQHAAPRSLVTQPVRLSPPDPRLSLAVGMVAMLVGVAVLKPWGSLGAPATAPPRVVVVTPTPSVEPTDASPEGLADPVCLGAGAWRVASLESWQTQDVRVWRAVEPIPDANGPLDPAIPAVPVVAVELEALGWCAPAWGPDEPVGPAVVDAWQVRGQRASVLTLLQVRPEHGTTPITALYVPLGPCDASSWCPAALRSRVPQAWGSGRVVFRVEDEGTGGVGWFAADVELVAPRGAASPAPGG